MSYLFLDEYLRMTSEDKADIIAFKDENVYRALLLKPVATVSNPKDISDAVKNFGRNNYPRYCVTLPKRIFCDEANKMLAQPVFVNCLAYTHSSPKGWSEKKTFFDEQGVQHRVYKGTAQDQINVFVCVQVSEQSLKWLNPAL